MAIETIYTLGASLVTVSNGKEISGFSQGAGTHLTGETITLTSSAWEAISVNDTADADFADNESGSQRLNGAQSLDGVSYANNTGVEAEYTVVVEDPDGNQYTLVAFNIREPGEPNAYGTVEGLAFIGDVGGFPPRDVPLTVISNAEGPSVLYDDLATPACFTAGSKIETQTGATPIEDLCVGDLVRTQDHGWQPVRWIGATVISEATLRWQPQYRPILVRRHAFGPNVPNRDMRLSPQHRVLVTGFKAELFFGEPEILVPICKLRNDRHIMTDHLATSVHYFHILLEQHSIIFVDGAPSESYFWDGKTADNTSMGRELEAVFGDQFCAATAPNDTARPCFSDKRVQLL